MPSSDQTKLNVRVILIKITYACLPVAKSILLVPPGPPPCTTQCELPMVDISKKFLNLNHGGLLTSSINTWVRLLNNSLWPRSILAPHIPPMISTWWSGWSLIVWKGRLEDSHSATAASSREVNLEVKVWCYLVAYLARDTLSPGPWRP